MANEMRRVYVAIPMSYSDSEVDAAEREAGGQWFFQGHRERSDRQDWSIGGEKPVAAMYAQYYVDCADEESVKRVEAASQKRGWKTQFNDQF